MLVIILLTLYTDDVDKSLVALALVIITLLNLVYSDCDMLIITTCSTHFIDYSIDLVHRLLYTA